MTTRRIGGTTMTRLTRKLVLLIALVALAVVAPAAASAAKAPNGGGVPGSVLTAGGVAGAAKPAAKAKVVRLNRGAQTARAGTTGTRLPVVDGHAIAIKPKTGGSTGDGPADEAECERWAGLINGLIGLALHDLDEGNAEGAAHYAAEADKAENDALDRGCFIVD